MALSNRKYQVFYVSLNNLRCRLHYSIRSTNPSAPRHYNPPSLQHYEQDADGLCTQLLKPLPKRKPLEFDCDDEKAFKDAGWVINRKDLQVGWIINRKELQVGWVINRKELQVGWVINRKDLQVGWVIYRKDLQVGWVINRKDLQVR